MNILIFGPNGSGKGTQGAIIQKKYNLPHVESGAIFRKNISGGTDLGKKAKAYIDRGDLVPDDITIPMILDRLKEDDCKKGWLLDGFPRNVVQAETLHKALSEAGIKLDYVIEIALDRKTAADRIMGRRLCVNDNNHPNHVYIDAIKPVEKEGKIVCRVCGGDLKTRPDDQDAGAINKRHDIYYDTKSGTMAAVNYFKNIQGPKVIAVDGAPPINEVSQKLMSFFS
ncbi:MAG: adenylate kinase [Nitrospirota bacterium]